jgi:hypothetical protein
MELERVGEPNDPVEGSNVTLICSISALERTLNSMWSYQIKGNGGMQIIDDKNPPPGLKALAN